MKNFRKSSHLWAHVDFIPRKFVIYGGGKPLNFFGLWKELGLLSGSLVALMRLSESTFNLPFCLVNPLQTLSLGTSPWKWGCPSSRPITSSVSGERQWD